MIVSTIFFGVFLILSTTIHSFPFNHLPYQTITSSSSITTREKLSQQVWGKTTTSTKSKSTTSTTLWVKAVKKKKSNKKKTKNSNSGSGGGFGISSVSSNENEKENDDYSMFPPLEESVTSTLIPSKDCTNVGDIDQEMYDRLEQIYGFPQFNYLSTTDDEDDEEDNDDVEPTLSFNELLSLDDDGDDKGTNDPFKSEPNLFSQELGLSKSSDFTDLIASAASNTNPSDTTTTTTSTSTSSRSTSSAASVPSMSLNLSQLRPFTQFRILHIDPMILAIDDFFTMEECDAYIQLASDNNNNNKNNNKNNKNGPTMEVVKTRSKTVGKDHRSKAQRTSTTWFHHYQSVPELMARASRLLGLKGIQQWEEPQTVRYQRTEKFTWHLDALNPSANELNDQGGQRVATLLVYLTDLNETDGGATLFRDLGGSDGPLKVQPKKGSALLFFPAAGGISNVPFDIRTVHSGEVVSSDASKDKWIAQLWLRQYTYVPTAPPGNNHVDAMDPINDYCMKNSSLE